MAKLINYDGHVNKAHEFIIKWFRDDPYIQRTDASIISFLDGERSDVEPDPNADNVVIRIIPGQRGWAIVDSCKTIETTLVFTFDIMVPSYFASDGLNLWELIAYAFWECTREPISKCSRYGIGDITTVTPAVGLIPGNVARGEISISMRYPLERQQL